MPKADKIPCPECGTPMNHHADKLDYAAASAGSRGVDPDLGGVLQQTHTCPNCKYILFRAVS